MTSTTPRPPLQALFALPVIDRRHGAIGHDITETLLRLISSRKKPWQRLSPRGAPANIPGLPESRVKVEVDASLQPNDPQRRVFGETGHEGNHPGRRSSIAVATVVGAQRPPNEEVGVQNVTTESGASGAVSVGGSRATVRGMGVRHAVIAAVQELARMSPIPGVAEAAGWVIILMKLATDSSNNMGTAGHMVKRSRSFMGLLRRAASVLKEVCIHVTGEAGYLSCS